MAVCRRIRAIILLAFIVGGICWATEDPLSTGVILSFDEPGLNDVVAYVLHRDTEVEAYFPDGSVVEDDKLSQFTLSLERRCYESPQEGGDPDYRDCRAGHYHLATLRYGDHHTLDCLRVSPTTTALETVISSVRPVVLKRFHLKVYYLTASGQCYYKYFTLPVYECSADRHHWLDSKRCGDLFGAGAGPRANKL